jgi:hypothetical protein
MHMKVHHGWIVGFLFAAGGFSSIALGQGLPNPCDAQPPPDGCPAPTPSCNCGCWSILSTQYWSCQFYGTASGNCCTADGPPHGGGDVGPVNGKADFVSKDAAQLNARNCPISPHATFGDKPITLPAERTIAVWDKFSHMVKPEAVAGLQKLIPNHAVALTLTPEKLEEIREYVLLNLQPAEVSVAQSEAQQPVTAGL